MIQRKYENGITPDEARKALEKFGKIKSCSLASPFERSTFFVYDGVVVSFQMYDMGQAAMQVISLLILDIPINPDKNRHSVTAMSIR